MERKKKGHIQGRVNRRMLVLNPNIQEVVVNLHTKILTFYLEQLLRNLLRKIASTDCREKEKKIYIRKNIQDNAGYLSHDTTCNCYSVCQI